MWLLSNVFLLGSLATGTLLAGADSLYRAYSFTGVFVILGLVMLWSGLFRDARRPEVAWVGLLGVGLCLLLPIKGLVRFFPRETLTYAMGGVSTRDALSNISHTSRAGTTYEDFVAAKQRIPADGRMLHLCYEPGPGYCIPAPIVVTEPSHSFAGCYEQLLFDEPHEARRIFHELKIDHFGVNVKAQLFLGLPYSPLFRPDSLRENFTVAWRHGDYFLLTWRGPHDPPPPEEMIDGFAELQAAENRFAKLYDTWLARRNGVETKSETPPTRIARRKESTGEHE